MITFIRNLNCFKSEEEIYPRSLKQPLQIKVTTIKKTNDLLKKIIAIALIVLLICGIFIPIAPLANNDVGHVTRNNNSSIRIPTYLRPYSNQLFLKAFPDSLKPITTFPSYVKKVIYPGKMSGENGRLCVIPDSMPTFEECHKVSMFFEAQAKKSHSSTYEDYITDPKLISGTGGFIDWAPNLIETPIKRVYFGMDRRKVTAYQEALFFVEQEVLNSLDFFEKDDGALMESIKKTNAFVTKYLSEIPGQLRSQMALLLNDNIEISRKGLRNVFYQQGGSLKDIKNFHSLYDKLEKYDLLDTAIKYLNVDEIRVLKMIGYIPCQPKEIDSKLYKLANQIKELVLKIKNQKTNAIATAAYVHQELIKITPFMHGNGRTARIWMNIILQIGGFEAVVIPKHNEYANEVIKDRKSPGTFVSYLEQVIEWNRMQTNLKVDED